MAKLGYSPKFYIAGANDAPAVGWKVHTYIA